MFLSHLLDIWLAFNLCFAELFSHCSFRGVCQRGYSRNQAAALIAFVALSQACTAKLTSFSRTVLVLWIDFAA